MIPILFGSVDLLLVDENNDIFADEDGVLFTTKDERMDFDTLGIGAMGETISCVVTEERNGLYELHLTYPVTGRRFKDIKEGAVIKATPSKNRVPDYFRIYKVTKPLSGIIEVDAEHISYQLSHIPVMPFTASSCAAALLGLKTNSAESNPFTFWTDKATAAAYKQTVPASCRSRLGGTAGSILDVYGGEYEFDRYDVKLYANRGADNGVTLRYGKNITDLNQESNIANTITGICPYWSDNEGGNVVTLPEKVVSSPKSGLFPYPRTVVKDFSQNFQDKPTVAQLRTAAESYVASAGIGVPDVSIEVKFVDLSSTDEAENIGLLEQVKLCDIVTVIFEPFDIEAKAKVTKTVWNVLKDRYDEVLLGNARSNISGIVAANERSQEEALTSTKSALALAIDHATEQITGADGGYVVINRDADGNPVELLIMNTPDINTATRVWRWNQNGLGVSNNGYAGPYETAMTADGHFVANFITAGTMIATLIKAGILSDLAGNFYLNMETGELKMLNGTFTGAITGSTINNGSGTFTVSANGNVVANSFQSNNANITGGTINILTASALEDSIILRYGNQSIHIYPNRVSVQDVTTGFESKAYISSDGLIVDPLNSSYDHWVNIHGSDMGTSITLRNQNFKRFFLVEESDAYDSNGHGRIRLYDQNGTVRVSLTSTGLTFFDSSGNQTRTYSAT